MGILKVSKEIAPPPPPILFPFNLALASGRYKSNIQERDQNLIERGENPGSTPAPGFDIEGEEMTQQAGGEPCGIGG
jgi:hypothetical protein